MQKIQAEVWPGVAEAHYVYNVGSNLSGGFAIGHVGQKDDFWIAGLPVPDDLFRPLLSGTILGKDGEVLLRLADGWVTFNPHNCPLSFIMDETGLRFEIRTPDGETILKVESYTKPDQQPMCRISGVFYGKVPGDVVARIVSDEGVEHLELRDNVPALVGAKSFGPKLLQHQFDFLKAVVFTRGLINHILTGEVSDADIDIDGAYIYNLTATRCQLSFSVGYWLDGKVIRDKCGSAASGVAGFVVGDAVTGKEHQAVQVEHPIR